MTLLLHYCANKLTLSQSKCSQSEQTANSIFLFFLFFIFRSSQRDNTLQVFHKYLRRGCLCPSFRRRIQRQLLINSRRHDIVHTFHHECREGSPSMLHLCLPFLQYMIRSLFANSLDYIRNNILFPFNALAGGAKETTEFLQRLPLSTKVIYIYIGPVFQRHKLVCFPTQ